MKSRVRATPIRWTTALVALTAVAAFNCSHELAQSAATVTSGSPDQGLLEGPESLLLPIRKAAAANALGGEGSSSLARQPLSACVLNRGLCGGLIGNNIRPGFYWVDDLEGRRALVRFAKPYDHLFWSSHIAESRNVDETAAQTVDYDTVVVHFAMQELTSVQNQYVDTEIFMTLLQRRASKAASALPCEVRISPRAGISTFDFTAIHKTPTQRDECLRRIIDYILHEDIVESDFLAARETKARWTETWTTSKRVPLSAVERLAYLRIYRESSPLYQLYLVDKARVVARQYKEFRQWMNISREMHLIHFDAVNSLLRILGLPTVTEPETAYRISLASDRNPPGVMFFDGSQFGFHALVMVGLDPSLSDKALRDWDSWKRFSCNHIESAQLDDDAKAHSIASVTCFAQTVFGVDPWLGLAISKSEGARYDEFCRQVTELSRDSSISALVQVSSERFRGLYLILPKECENKG